MDIRQGEININKADLQELARIPGIGEEEIRSILEFRNEHGPFRRWKDFDEMPGLESSLKERVHFFSNLGDEGGEESGA